MALACVSVQMQYADSSNTQIWEKGVGKPYFNLLRITSTNDGLPYFLMEGKYSEISRQSMIRNILRQPGNISPVPLK